MIGLISQCSLEPSGDWLESGLLKDVEWLWLDVGGAAKAEDWLGNWHLLLHFIVLLMVVVNLLLWSEHLAHEITKRIESLVLWDLLMNLRHLLVLLLVVWSEHRSEQVTNWVELLVVGLGLGLGWENKLSLRLFVVMMVRWMEESLGGVMDFLEELIDSLEEINEVWEHQREFIQLGQMTELSDFLMEFLLEDTSLDVLWLNRLVPLNVNTIDISAELSEVSRYSVNLVHKFLVGVTRVILHEKFEEIEADSHDLEHAVEQSILKTFKISALTWVLEAEVLHVVSNSLEFADIIKFVHIIDQ